MNALTRVENGTSPLDRPLAVTFFRDHTATTKDEKSLTLRQLVPMIRTTTAPEKAALPWLKLASFGDGRTRKGSLRNNANVLAIDGVEADYDAGVMTPEQAVAALTAANLAAVVYTSPSHQAHTPKWRVLCPLADTTMPEERAALTARLNGVLGGKLARESFTLSQAYYYGSVRKNPAHVVLLVEGRPLDEAVELEAVSPAKVELPKIKPAGKPATPAPEGDDRGLPAAALREACALFEGQTGVGRHQVLLAATLVVAPFVASGHLPEDEVIAGLTEAMSDSGRDPNDNEVESALAGALKDVRPWEPPTGGAEFDGEDAPEGGEPAEGGDHWKSMLLRSEKGNAQANLYNAQIAFMHAPEWRGAVAHDDFTDKDVWRRPAPWMARKFEPGAEMADHDFTDAAAWLQANGINIAAGPVREAMVSVAAKRRFSSAREYLERVQWDGVPRLDTILIDHLGAEDTLLARQFAAKTIIAAVARVFQPGCKVKTILTLEGSQDIGKSLFCETLVPVKAWFTDTTPDLSNKDSLAQLRGILIQEHAELATLGKADANRVKAFLSSNVDRYRPAFGRVARDYPRQCIFVATVNPGATGYLKDETGGSRFWPVVCGIGWAAGRTFDASALASARDQLWAEAVHRFKAGESWWLADAATKAAQVEAADARYDSDVWTAPVLDYLDEHRQAGASTEEILAGAIRKNIGEWTRADQIRIGAIVVRAGWDRRRATLPDGSRAWRYFPPPEVVSFASRRRRPPLASVMD